jgi:hypothetical protein
MHSLVKKSHKEHSTAICWWKVRKQKAKASKYVVNDSSSKTFFHCRLPVWQKFSGYNKIMN